MSDLNEEQRRALSQYHQWHTRLLMLEARAGDYRDYEWRLASTAEVQWASACRRHGLPFPKEHLQKRYVA